MASGAPSWYSGVITTDMYQVILPGDAALLDSLSREEVTKAVYNLSLRLQSLVSAAEARVLCEYIVNVCRSYTMGEPALYSLSLAQGLRHLSECQSMLGLPDESLVVAEESVNILRGLRA